MPKGLVSLAELFQKRLFRIPDYQRGYAWKKDQLDDFWEDLVNLHEDRFHYTGLLSLKEVSKENSILSGDDSWILNTGYKAYHIVDGQQRITTFSILMHEILSLVQNLEENKEKPDDQIFIGSESIKAIREKYIIRSRPPENMIHTYKFGYEQDNPSYRYLRHKIFNESFGGTIVETYYTQNLKYAKLFFSKNLESLYDVEGIEGIVKLYEKLTLKLMFNLHEIEDDYDVFVAFETMNNRGKKLSNLELLKNRLIYLTTLFDDNELDETDKTHLRQSINDAWKEIYFQLGRNQKFPLSDDDFLRAHWTMYFKYSRAAREEYIVFLLNKFSSRNIFDKHPVLVNGETSEPLIEEEDLDGDIDENAEDEILLVSKLAPRELRDYVNSIKEIAEYWYYTFFPHDSDELTDDEKQWIMKLNRVGLGYFRPLVTVSLSLDQHVRTEDRIQLFKAIERFIFIHFRMGGYNASYKSSHYYKKTKELLDGKTNVLSLIEDLTETTNSGMNPVIASFIARNDRRFESGRGFYDWRDLRYFLYEYESQLSTEKNIQKMDWQMFIRVEKDKVTIEHILPQTATRWYWQNQFRQFSENEINTLSGSLGNLLPLSQSINSSLQNDSFPDKKSPSGKRRGYVDGSHSEIEVSLQEDWTAESILNRGLKLIKFMEKRWDFTLTEEQRIQLLHLDFVKEEREEVPEIPEATLEEETDIPFQSPSNTQDLTDFQLRRYQFWSHFVEYCHATGKGKEIASRKPHANRDYDVSIGSNEYYIIFQAMKKNILRIAIYVHDPEAYIRLEGLKDQIETVYGSSLDWYTTRKNTVGKRIVHSVEADVYNPEKYKENFDWLITQFHKLKTALEEVDGLGRS